MMSIMMYGKEYNIIFVLAVMVAGPVLMMMRASFVDIDHSDLV